MKLIDSGILETGIFLPLEVILREITKSLSRPEFDKSLKDLVHINGLELLDENIEETIDKNIKI